MKHKDGLDMAAVMLLLLAAVAVMVVPVALVKPQLLAIPAVLVLIALCVVLYQRRRLRAFLAKQLCSTDFENSRIQYSLTNLPIATVLVNDGRILWYNGHFREQVLGDCDAVTRPVDRVLPELDLGRLLPPAWAGPDGGGTALYGLLRRCQRQPRCQPCISDR